MSKRVIIGIGVVVVLMAACIAQPLWTDSNSEYHHSPEQTHTIKMPASSPVALTVSKAEFRQASTTESRHHCHTRRCVRRHDFKRMRKDFHHTKARRHTIRLGSGTARSRQVNILCRTEVMKLNWTDGIATMGTAQGSIHRCWVPKTNRVLMGDNVPVRYRATIAHQCKVTDYGSAWMWHCDDQGVLVVNTNSVHCEGSECWDYMFRRWIFSYGRDIWVVHQHMNCNIDVTANGLGQGKGGADC